LITLTGVAHAGGLGEIRWCARTAPTDSHSGGGDGNAVALMVLMVAMATVVLKEKAVVKLQGTS
jgi:hypothetical protein